MSDTLKILLEEFEKYKGQFVIVEKFSIEKLIALAEDDMDYYYVTWDGRKTTWNTCVDDIIPLKGYITDEKYKSIVQRAKLNYFESSQIFNNPSDETSDFNEKVKKEVENISEKDGRYLTPICWDFN